MDEVVKDSFRDGKLTDIILTDEISMKRIHSN